jgi:Dictyostelium (slime mold) repeat
MRIQTTRTLLVVLTALAAALVLSRPVEAEPPKADGERCRTNQSCQSGICEKEFGARFGVCAPSCINDPVICDDIDACTTDSCDSFTGECEFRPINCDDNNACTEDFCDTFRGCVNNDICEG